MTMISDDFVRQLEGYGLATASILYPPPRFLGLKCFLDFRTRELGGPLHTVTVAHARLIRPAEFQAVAGEFRLN